MEERKGFGSTFGFLMAAVGSAVGLGNIWGFPNKMGANGGFTFLIIYLILAALCGFIVMVGELALGRRTGRGVVSAYYVLSKKFKWLGPVPDPGLLLRSGRLLHEVCGPECGQHLRRRLRQQRLGQRRGLRQYAYQSA